MKNKKDLNIQFYEILGKLFYAIAAVDGTVKPVEFNKLKEILKTQWLLVDSTEDHFYIDSAYQIEMAFDCIAAQNNLNSEILFKQFIYFKNQQNHFFTEPIKKLIIKTANEIANSFSQKNKSELILLAKLDMELKKI